MKNIFVGVKMILVANSKETFFTIVGCMDGRLQGPAVEFGRETFQTEYPDTITEAGTVGVLANNPETVEGAFKFKLGVSLDKHKSNGIVVGGHSECAGHPVPDDQQKEDIVTSVELIKNWSGNRVPVVGIFVTRSPEGDWVANSLETHS